MAVEPAVGLRSLPRGYSFVRKGNVYITSNCRKQTQTANETVYVVQGRGNKQLGIAVPTPILRQVRQDEADTRNARAANVQKRDQSIHDDFEAVIQREFPLMPPDSLPKVLHTALQKRKGKVGRTGTLSNRDKAHLAVRAHIRHSETPYEQLMESGLSREQARDMVAPQVDAIAQSWAPAFSPLACSPEASVSPQPIARPIAVPSASPPAVVVKPKTLQQILDKARGRGSTRASRTPHRRRMRAKTRPRPRS